MNRIGLLLIFRRLTYAVHFLPFSFIGVLAIKSKFVRKKAARWRQASEK